MPKLYPFSMRLHKDHVRQRYNAAARRLDDLERGETEDGEPVEFDEARYEALYDEVKALGDILNGKYPYKNKSAIELPGEVLGYAKAAVEWCGATM